MSCDFCFLITPELTVSDSRREGRVEEGGRGRRGHAHSVNWHQLFSKKEKKNYSHSETFLICHHGCSDTEIKLGAQRRLATTFWLRFHVFIPSFSAVTFSVCCHCQWEGNQMSRATPIITKITNVLIWCGYLSVLIKTFRGTSHRWWGLAFHCDQCSVTQHRTNHFQCHTHVSYIYFCLFVIYFCLTARTLLNLKLKQLLINKFHVCNQQFPV